MKKKMLYIDVKELELIGWLAKQTFPHVKKPSDISLANKAMRNYARMVKIINSWEKK